MSRNSIASTRNISRHSVSDVFRIADEKGIHFKDVRDLDETAAYQLFYPEKHAYETMYGDPDYPHVHEELKKTGVTLKLLHEEYVEKCQAAGEIPMGKTKFNEGYARSPERHALRRRDPVSSRHGYHHRRRSDKDRGSREFRWSPACSARTARRAIIPSANIIPLSDPGGSAALLNMWPCRRAM